MKKLLAVLAVFAGIAAAEIVPGQTRTIGGLTISTAIPEKSPGVVVFLRTTDPRTSTFQISVTLQMVDGASITVRTTAAKFRDDVPGTYWTVVNVPSPALVSRIASIAVDELASIQSTFVD